MEHGPDCNMMMGASDQTHTMAGIPLWMSILGLALIIICSHLFLSKNPQSKTKDYSRFNLFKISFVHSLVKRSYFPMLLQIVPILLFLLVIGAGLLGNERNNIATVLTWTWWWSLLIFIIVFLGKSFCMICPWEGLANLITTLSFKSRKRKLGSDLHWPRQLRNIYPAMILFIVLTWFELGYDATKSPSLTAIMALTMAVLAIGVSLFFEKKVFCRYICLVGRISGMYSLFAPVEIRSVSSDVCKSCKTKDCLKGNSAGQGCPTGIFPGANTENTYCTMCTECVRTCPYDNMSLNVRPPAEDLVHKTLFKQDESIMTILLLALTSFHGITMTPIWTRMTDLLRIELGLGKTLVFTILMVLFIALTYGIFVLGAKASKPFLKNSGVSYSLWFRALSYSLLPVALFYHLAHNGMHFFMEAQYLIPVLSDPFSMGWDLFGTAMKPYPAILTLRSIWWLQLILILIGHLYGVIVADRITHKLLSDPKARLKSLIPMIITMILYSGFSLWLISQPMEMRSGM